MATFGPLIDDGSQTVAGVDLSAAAKQYSAVKLTAARTVGLASTGGEAIYGILQNTPAAGEAADVGILGISKAVVGAAGATAGAALMTEAVTGYLTDQTSTNAKVAVAITGGVSGEIITVRIVPTAG